MRFGRVAAGVALWVVVGCGRTGYGLASQLEGDGGSGDGGSSDRDGAPGLNGPVRDEPLFVGDPVPVASGDAMEPCLEWTGSDFGLAWTVDGESKKAIMFRRLDAAGTAIGTPVEVASMSTDRVNQPDLVWTGSQYGLVWSQGTTAEVWFVRISAEGQIIGSPARISDDDAIKSLDPTVAWSGTNFVVAWDDLDTSSVRSSVLSPDGQVIDGPTTMFASELQAGLPSLTWVGGPFFVSFYSGFSGGKCALYTPGETISEFISLELYLAPPVAAFRGDPIFGVAWRAPPGGSGIGGRFARMNADGELIGEIIPILDERELNQVLITTDGTDYVVTFSCEDEGLYASRFDASGNVLVQEARIGDGLASFTLADLSPADGGYAMVWEDGDGGISFRTFNP